MYSLGVTYPTIATYILEILKTYRWAFFPPPAVRYYLESSLFLGLSKGC